MRGSGERPHSDHEVVVLGGGPAGCAAATLLAKDGHGVALVCPGAPPAGGLAQSIPPSATRLLTELDVLDALTRGHVHPNLGNTVWWAGENAVLETFEEARAGFHIDRIGLEIVLLSVARAAGVRVYDGTVRSAVEGEGGWRVEARSVDGATVDLRAPWVLDATGRRGIVAVREGRQIDRSTTTVAIVRRWKRPGGFPRVDPAHTLVESYRDGWAWSVPLGPEVRCFTAMVDHRFVRLSGASLDATLDGELDKAPHIRNAKNGAVPLGNAWACPASLYTAERFGRTGLLLIGDAGSFIDPLSSFGVKKALSSGWLAAIVVHTALTNGGMGETAVRFFDDREREVYRSYRARSTDFFEACDRAYDHPYWRGRAEAARAAGGHVRESSDPAMLEEGAVPPEAARAALEQLRARPRLDAVRGGSVRMVERPAVVGHRIVLTRHLASDRVPEGLRWVRNVDLARLVELAPRHPDVPDGWAAYNAEAPGVALPDYLAALATAFAAGLLEHSR